MILVKRKNIRSYGKPLSVAELDRPSGLRVAEHFKT